jgi:hypothetical protein
VYDRVIDDVLENVRLTFQDEGVDSGVLETLKDVSHNRHRKPNAYPLTECALTILWVA